MGGVECGEGCIAASYAMGDGRMGRAGLFSYSLIHQLDGAMERWSGGTRMRAGGQRGSSYAAALRLTTVGAADRHPLDTRLAQCKQRR